MKSLTLKNLLVALTIFVIFVNNGSNADTVVIEAVLKKNDPDKELVARQSTTINCIGYFDDVKINKAFIDRYVGIGIMIPKNAIYATLTTECNIRSMVKLDSVNSKLEKYDNNQLVRMKGSTVRSIGKGASPKTPGWFVIERYLLWADPSECLNAPNEGLQGYV